MEKPWGRYLAKFTETRVNGPQAVLNIIDDRCETTG